jgi:UDP-N-acetylglucosamine:LPS N-acetylglucosamine transferase
MLALTRRRLRGPPASAPFVSPRGYRRTTGPGRGGCSRASGAATRSTFPDSRAETFARRVPEIEFHLIRAGQFGGGPAHAAHALGELALGVLQARRLLRRLAPACVIGFGGYPSVPTMLAAVYLGLPTVIHEQNAVLGRANRLLAPRVWRIAAGFPVTAGLRPADRARTVYTGNPVRPRRWASGRPVQTTATRRTIGC